MAEIEKGFDELSAQTTEMSSHVSNAGKLLFCPNPHTFTQARDALTLQFVFVDKQVKLMRLAVLAFDTKSKIDYHDDSPKGRWHRGFRKIR